MATVYRAPLDPPKLDSKISWKEYENLEEEYIQQLRDYLSEHAMGGESPLLGKIVRFPIADGYAQYMVWSTKPLQLIHLALGDAWQIPDAYARGLRLTDIKSMIRQDESLRNLFGKSKYRE